MPQIDDKYSKSKVLERDWEAYYNAVVGRPPRETLLAALARFDAEASEVNSRFAVDLGCGEGRDTVELLRRGWHVLAIDGQAEAIARLRLRPDIDPIHLEKQFASQVIRFEDANLPTSVDLVNASFSLPFCPPDRFPSLWARIVISLKTGGRFCGQILGDRDSWATYTSTNHHSRKEVEELLRSFAIEMLEEEEHLGKTAIGEEKYWHIFHIVARKR
ncbi:class I SAM-dependent methyltransferase [Pseudanabaena sp. PCC 6802]|uniref:class I SAM-dependent methyltransferase n=1 Tax=Pseudanabaena sp. PCC 6802 TaxID=118173 RepID=UPI0003482777|nr:class I SAM-dependent methyltransferase [Pseudanabaena sp. PCC 6802]